MTAEMHTHMRIRISYPVYGSKGPDPYRTVTDPEQCLKLMLLSVFWIQFQVQKGQYGLQKYINEEKYFNVF